MSVMASLTEFGLKDQKAATFDPIPAGEYRAVVTKSEMKPTKDGTGRRLNVTLQITEGPFQNRTLFDGFNVVNASAKAQEISRAQLKSLCIAVNVPDPQNSEQLHNKKMLIRVGVRKGQDGTDENTIKGYKALLPSTPPAKPATPAAEPNMVEQAFEEQPEPAEQPAKRNPFA